MTKRMSYTCTVCFKLKAIELAEATSNRNAGKELGIHEKLELVRDRRKKKMELVTYQEQAERSGRSKLTRKTPQ